MKAFPNTRARLKLCSATVYEAELMHISPITPWYWESGVQASGRALASFWWIPNSLLPCTNCRVSCLKLGWNSTSEVTYVCGTLMLCYSQHISAIHIFTSIAARCGSKHTVTESTNGSVMSISGFNDLCIGLWQKGRFHGFQCTDWGILLSTHLSGAVEDVTRTGSGLPSPCVCAYVPVCETLNGKH